jgi:hypothetical protein
MVVHDNNASWRLSIHFVAGVEARRARKRGEKWQQRRRRGGGGGGGEEKRNVLKIKRYLCEEELNRAAVKEGMLPQRKLHELDIVCLFKLFDEEVPKYCLPYQALGFDEEVPKTHSTTVRFKPKKIPRDIKSL